MTHPTRRFGGLSVSRSNARRTCSNPRLLLLACLSPVSANIAPQLSSLVFLHTGTARAAANYSRLTQCSGFSECYTEWTCGSPRDYLYEVPADVSQPPRVPPMGLRSAVPLGGIGAGTLELRADGTFADWMIEGQGTGLAANAAQNSKIPLKDEAFLALYSSAPQQQQSQAHSEVGAAGAIPFAAALRTAPLLGVPGVGALNYSGAYPFSKLTISDAGPGAGGGGLPYSASLFAFSRYAVSEDPSSSALPYVVFSLVLSAAPGLSSPINVSLMLSLPLSSSLDTHRPFVGGSDTRNQTMAQLPGVSAAQCRQECEATGGCVWWTHSGPGTPNTTMVDSDCSGDDIYSPLRIAVASLQGCIEQCTRMVPGCRGLVFDTIRAEQQQQCGNSNASLSCCLPKTSCTDFGSKAGDTAWALGSPGDICTLFSGAPAVEQFLPGSGVRSGVKGAWSTAPSALTLTRANGYDHDPSAAFQDPGVADMSYSLLAADDDAAVTFAVTDSIEGGSWPGFATSGRLPLSSLPAPASGSHGAIAAMVPLHPGETRSVTLVFAWAQASRMYTGQELGTFYASQTGGNSSLGVARAAAAALNDTVEHGVAWNALWTAPGVSLPEWFADFLMNSVAAQAKMSVWVARGADLQPLAGGRFRQFEAFSGCDLAPVHVLDYSMIPYLLYFPGLLKNELLSGWAARQAPNGMINEFLGDFSAPGGRLTGPMDTSAGGRVMGDVTTVFLLATLGVVRATNDTDFLAAMWPSIVRAAQWQIERGATSQAGADPVFDCPTYLQTTYDYLGLDAFPYATYNALLHNAAMRAIVRLAAIIGDTSPLARNASLSEQGCLARISSSLWVSGPSSSTTSFTAADGGGWWRAWQDANGTALDQAILSGSLHGQSWASFLGLGLLVPAANITSHLTAETAFNCEYGRVAGRNVSAGSCELGLLTMPGAAVSAAATNTTATRPSRGRGLGSGAPQWSRDASPSQSMDATTASILAGSGQLQGSHAQAVVALYRDSLHDLWHWMDLHAGPAGLTCGGAQLSGPSLAGQPFVNSHYARQLQGWAALLAVTGQQFDAGAGTLSFRPSCEGASPSPLRPSVMRVVLPFVIPGALGHVTVEWGTEGVRGSEGAAGAMATLSLLRGDLDPRISSSVLVHMDRCEGGNRAAVGSIVSAVAA